MISNAPLLNLEINPNLNQNTIKQCFELLNNNDFKRYEAGSIEDYKDIDLEKKSISFNSPNNHFSVEFGSKIKKDFKILIFAEKTHVSESIDNYALTVFNYLPDKWFLSHALKLKSDKKNNVCLVKPAPECAESISALLLYTDVFIKFFNQQINEGVN